MRIEGIDISETIKDAQRLLSSDKSLSPSVKAVLSLLITIITLLYNRLTINSANSSKPPSQDPNRTKETVKNGRKKRGNRKPGGQKGHVGSTLERVENPDEIELLSIDRRTLPPGDYKEAGYESRQVFDIKVSLHVTEYRAEVLEDGEGNRYIAEFPEGVNKAVQYGNEVKAESVYMSQSQLIPYERVRENFEDQLGLPISKGSIVNFNNQAYEMLGEFEAIAKQQLLSSPVNHGDETGINVGGERLWLHNLSNEKWTLLYPHKKRGKEAMDEMGVLPHYTGVLCHDHWKPYYRYNCTHSLCNSHHLRELERAWEQDRQRWAKQMQDLLLEMNEGVKSSGGVLKKQERLKYQKRYRTILTKGKKECPELGKTPGKRGKQKNSKSRNLLNRLIEYEEDVLRFAEVKGVPFTNNQGENDLRMTKVQQKISGCFRSIKGAKVFCRIRSFLITARKHGCSPTDALRMLFNGEMPEFAPQNEGSR